MKHKENLLKEKLNKKGNFKNERKRHPSSVDVHRAAVGRVVGEKGKVRSQVLNNTTAISEI